MDQILPVIAVAALPVLFAITLHEAAHGFVAGKLGDPTARMLGRLTLNPLRHIDPVGTLLVPAGLLVLAVLTAAPPFIFGWARPVPVNVNNLRHPRRGMAWVAVAGPAANLLMALFWALVMKLALMLQGSLDWAAMPLLYMGIAGITVNILLMVLNLLPLPPLDGGRVVAGFLPPRLAAGYDRIEPYGLIIVLGLLFTGVLGAVLFPLAGALTDAIRLLFGLPAWRP
ncbi:site-2 protease family protein [Ectothiorhodospira mobilis]|uniref:site-2 protease family protein n=1 Tax=Ectothiorhodospira mobilis TaxID=195064 RepID=UPI0019087027|nr:site-2 protease family protein [Ectothiorhodospira mobilis]MBK1690644.1 site-2 protease family protein [Ectothiorhodospira mobilis]